MNDSAEAQANKEIAIKGLHLNDEICIQMMNFVFKMMSFALKMMNRHQRSIQSRRRYE